MSAPLFTSMYRGKSSPYIVTDLGGVSQPTGNRLILPVACPCFDRVAVMEREKMINGYAVRLPAQAESLFA